MRRTYQTSYLHWGDVDQAYYNIFLAYKTCQKKSFVIPWSACVDAWKWAKINKFEMCKQPEDGVGEYWIYYSREVIKTDSLESSKIDRIMRRSRRTH